MPEFGCARTGCDGRIQDLLRCQAGRGQGAVIDAHTSRGAGFRCANVVKRKVLQSSACHVRVCSEGVFVSLKNCDVSLSSAQGSRGIGGSIRALRRALKRLFGRMPLIRQARIRRIRKSPLFNANFYADRNPDVVATGVDLAKHYALSGWREHRNPSAEFSTRRYLEANPDVAAAGTNPLLHYIDRGQVEGRQIYPVEEEAQIEAIRASGLFDADYYRATYPDIQPPLQDPIRHYCERGWREGRNPSEEFDTQGYLAAYADIKDAGINPLWHYVVAGRYEGRMSLCAGPGTKSFPSEERILEERREIAAWSETAALPRFSILTPLYNTPEAFLREMIESVLAQTYENWELCLADGSDDAHAYVERVVREYMARDNCSRPRIVYKRLAENKGISENTNACLAMAGGDYIGLLDHDDILHPEALYFYTKEIMKCGADFIYSDENIFHETINDSDNLHFKPDFSPDYLRSNNYICHLTVFSRKLYEQVGSFRQEFDGSQDYDMVLRLTEKAQHIVHIPKILYYWRAHAQSTAQGIHAKDYCIDAAKRALAEHLKRVGLKGTIEDAALPSRYRMRYEIKGDPLISIIIPNKDNIEMLKRCIDSILLRSSYQNFEIIVVENNSEQQGTFQYYETLTEERIRIVRWENEFNYPAINNFGAAFAKGEHILLLNNDTEVIAPDWLQEMLMFAQRKDVGAVGAKLYYPDDTVQHAGVILGVGGVAGHSHKHFSRKSPGYFGRLVLAQNLSAVTAACVMMPKKVFDEVGGLDEGYKVAFNDVDICMKIRMAGYLIVYTPYAELYHYESVSRGYEDTPEKVARFNKEIRRFKDLWGDELAAGDPYYNSNLTLSREDFSLR